MKAIRSQTLRKSIDNPPYFRLGIVRSRYIKGFPIFPKFKFCFTISQVHVPEDLPGLSIILVRKKPYLSCIVNTLLDQFYDAC